MVDWDREAISRPVVKISHVEWKTIDRQEIIDMDSVEDCLETKSENEQEEEARVFEGLCWSMYIRFEFEFESQPKWDRKWNIQSVILCVSKSSGKEGPLSESDHDH